MQTIIQYHKVLRFQQRIVAKSTTYLQIEVSINILPVLVEDILTPSMETLKLTLSGRRAPALAVCMILFMPAAVLEGLLGSSTTDAPRYLTQNTTPSTTGSLLFVHSSHSSVNEKIVSIEDSVSDYFLVYFSGSCCLTLSFRTNLWWITVRAVKDQQLEGMYRIRD